MVEASVCFWAGGSIPPNLQLDLIWLAREPATTTSKVALTQLQQVVKKSA